MQTIRDPEAVFEGDAGEKLAVRFYAATPVTSKYLVGPYREDARDGYVLTAYFARRGQDRRAQRPARMDYDEDADVLYLSVGKPRKATGVDIGDGVVVRYDERRNEVVGVTILGMRSRLTRQLRDNRKGKRS